MSTAARYDAYRKALSIPLVMSEGVSALEPEIFKRAWAEVRAYDAFDPDDLIHDTGTFTMDGLVFVWTLLEPDRVNLVILEDNSHHIIVRALELAFIGEEP